MNFLTKINQAVSLVMESKASEETLTEASKEGEGSRGGKVIGHTKSGKPIYATHGHPSHKKFTKQDHLDAAEAHDKAGEKHHWAHTSDEASDSKRLTKVMAHARQHHKHNASAKSMSESVLDEETKKEGEGSRGGKVIGHTESGKPIYASHGNKNHKTFSKEDHLDAYHHHSREQDRKSQEYHAQKNHDGTVSKKHVAKRKQLAKELAHHNAQKQAHYASHEGSKGGPDQKDFDKMDRKNGPQKRSKAWSKRESVEIQNDLGVFSINESVNSIIGASLNEASLQVESKEPARFSRGNAPDLAELKAWQKEFISVVKGKMQSGKVYSVEGAKAMGLDVMKDTVDEQTFSAFVKLIKKIGDGWVESRRKTSSGSFGRDADVYEFFDSLSLSKGESYDHEYGSSLENIGWEDGKLSILDKDWAENYLSEHFEEMVFTLPEDFENRFNELVSLSRKASGDNNMKLIALTKFKAVEFFEFVKKIDGAKVVSEKISKSKNNPKFYAAVNYTVQFGKLGKVEFNTETKKTRDGFSTSFECSIEALNGAHYN